MVVYGCKRCGYSTNNKSYIKKHLLRKFPCTNVLSNIPVDDIYEEIFGEKRDIAKNQKKSVKKTKKKNQNVSMLQKNDTFCVSMPDVIKNLPKSSYKQPNENNVSAPILHQKHADAMQKTAKNVTKMKNHKSRRNKDINSITSKNKSSTKLQNLKKVPKKNSVSIKKYNQNQEHFNNYNPTTDEATAPIMHRQHADAKMFGNNIPIKRPKSSNKLCYKKNTRRQIVQTNINDIDNMIILENSNNNEESSNNFEYNTHNYAQLNKYQQYNSQEPHCTRINSINDPYNPSYSDDEDSELGDSECYECKYCSRIFMHRQSRHRHEKSCKSQQTLQNKCEQLEMKLEKRDEEMKTLKVQLEKLLDRAVGEVHNHNTTNYTYNIMLNAFGQENSEYIDKNNVNKILKGGALSSIPKLIELLHFHPEHEENHNVLIPNRKENIAKVFNGKEWVFRRKNLTIDEMTNNAYNFITANYELGAIKYVDDFQEKYENGDKEVKKRVHKDSELMIINKQSNIAASGMNSTGCNTNTIATQSITNSKNGNTNSINSKIILHNNKYV